MIRATPILLLALLAPLLLLPSAFAAASETTNATVAPGSLDPRCTSKQEDNDAPGNAWDKTAASHSYPTGPSSCNSQSRNLTANPEANLYPTCLLPCTPRISSASDAPLWVVYALWALTALVVALFVGVKFAVVSLKGQGGSMRGSTLDKRESFGMPHSRRQSVHRTHGDDDVDDPRFPSSSPWSFGDRSKGGGSTGGPPGSGGGIEMKECGGDDSNSNGNGNGNNNNNNNANTRLKSADKNADKNNTNVGAVVDEAAEAMDVSLTLAGDGGDGGDDAMHVQTFSDSTYLGRFALFLLAVCSIQWILFFFVLVLDYYWECQWTGVDGMCLYGTYPIFGEYTTNSRVFFSNWVAMLVWYGTTITFYDKIRNFFRLPAPASVCDVVQVSVPDDNTEAVVSMYPAPAVRWLRQLRASCAKCNVRRYSRCCNGSICRMGGMTMGASMGGSGVGKRFRVSTVPVQKTPAGTRFFEFECQRFVYNDATDQFSAPKISVGATYDEVAAQGGGLTNAEAAARKELLGPNRIPFEADTIMQALGKEFFSYFYLYQLLIYSVWLWWTYLVVAAGMFTIVLLSAATNVYMSIKGQRTIQAISEYTTTVSVHRQDQKKEDHEELAPAANISSLDLVTGDVITVQGDWTLPCDLVIVRGTAVCDESGLTGESKPVRKAAIPTPSSEEYDALHGSAKHTLFAGTRVLQADGVTAVVAATGVRTSKGELVSQILFPPKVQFKYDEELPVAVGCLCAYGLFAFAMVLYITSSNGQDTGWTTSFYYGIFTISQVLSPLLPIALVAGQFAASSRLLKLGVFTVNPKKIAIAGKIRVYCFDKTGTLTKDGLDYIGAVVPDATGTLAAPAAAAAAGAAVSLPLLRGLASCHAVSYYGDTLVGNEVEVQMFSSSGWSLDETGPKPVLTPPAVYADQAATKGMGRLVVEKRFEFDHKRMTMSVVVRDESTGTYHVFCKGSAERVGACCHARSLPAGYETQAQGFALRGCYVLGLAHRELSKGEEAAGIDRIGRDDCEAGLAFVGLINFRNELKPDTAGAIEALKQGAVRPVMITGDNAQCGYYIAKACGMVAAAGEHSKVLLAEAAKGSGNSGDHDDRGVLWRWMSDAVEDGSSSGGEAKNGADDKQEQQQQQQLGRPDANSNDVLTTEQVLRGDLGSEGAELGVTGAAFDRLVASGDMEHLLLRTRIFARMSPEGKVLAVQMHMAKGLIVGMCGDGGNDCGALRTAHAGIALSEAEASVVSPFTSKTKSIVSVVDLLREGRGSLATSFAGYKFLITYGQLFCAVKLICMHMGVIMCAMDYVFIDVVIVVVLSWGMTLSYPKKELQKERPTSSLLGPVTMCSVLGMQAIHLIFLVICLTLMWQHPDYVKWPASCFFPSDAVVFFAVVDLLSSSLSSLSYLLALGLAAVLQLHLTQGGSFWFNGDNWETTVLFTCFAAQFMTAGLTFTLGSHYRRAVIYNYTVVITWVLGMVFVSVLLLTEENELTKVFHIASTHFNQENATSPVWAAWQDFAGKSLNGSSILDSGEMTAKEIAKWQKYGLDAALGAIGRTSGAMPFWLRFQIWLVIMISVLTALCFEFFVVVGPVADWVRRNFPSKRPYFRDG